MPAYCFYFFLPRKTIGSIESKLKYLPSLHYSVFIPKNHIWYIRTCRDRNGIFYLYLVVNPESKDVLNNTSFLFNFGTPGKNLLMMKMAPEEKVIYLWEANGRVNNGTEADIFDLITIENLIRNRFDLKEHPLKI